MFKLSLRRLSCTPADFSCCDSIDSVNECQCCKPIFIGSLSSLIQSILLLAFKGNGMLTAYPKELTRPCGVWEWLGGMKGQMEPERTKTSDVWLAIELLVLVVWCLWAVRSLTGQTVKHLEHCKLDISSKGYFKVILKKAHILHPRFRRKICLHTSSHIVFIISTDGLIQKRWCNKLDDWLLLNLAGH